MVTSGITDKFQVALSDGAVTCGPISSGAISSGDVTSSGIVKGHIVGDIDYASTTAQSTINIGQNSTLSNTINIGKTNDSININGPISSVNITSSGIVKGHIVGDIDYASTTLTSTINIGRNSTSSIFNLNTINIGKPTDLIYINGSLYSPMSSYFASNYINQFA